MKPDFFDGYLLGQARWWLLISVIAHFFALLKEMYSMAIFFAVLILVSAYYVGLGYGYLLGLQRRSFRALPKEEKYEKT